MEAQPTQRKPASAKWVARAAIALAFTRLGAEALFAGHHPLNASSRRTLLKLGFRYLRDEPYAATGLQHPSYRLERPAAAG